MRVQSISRKYQTGYNYNIEEEITENMFLHVCPYLKQFHERKNFLSTW